VLASAIAATQAQQNPLGFRAVKSAVVVLVDGLGLENLEAFAGHAPNLMKAWKQNPKAIRSECPSTTVVGLVSLASGLRAGDHGLIGYNVLRKGELKATNLLSGWEQTGAEPTSWKQYDTISETNSITVVSPSLYERSGFTALTMPLARFVGENDLQQRLAIAAKLAKEQGAIVYVYVPELDQAGHRFGCTSDAWIAQLETLDSAFARTAFDASTGVVITADHGMVDVDPANHVYLEQLESLREVEFITGGDTRCAYLYLSNSDQAERIQQQVEIELGASVYVCKWYDLVSAGWQRPPKESNSIPDLVILAKDRLAFYDRRTAKHSSMRMVGHHGSITDQETRIPLITLGF
jgi:predicted AlkP superfamily pyrophosphatase or phosphodiesterase